MLNVYFLLQFVGICFILFFYNTINIFTYWYLSGLYLLSLGSLMLIREADIFVGFLWVIDLGVGLIFFIFILHFTQFLFQKSFVNLIVEKFTHIFLFFLTLLIFFFFLGFAENNAVTANFYKIWFFFISWVDYYENFLTTTVTDLQLLRELYFYNSSFEFFLLNFLLAYAIFTAIVLSFIVKKMLITNFTSNFKNFNLKNKNVSFLFIRNQNFLKQQHTSTGTRTWQKKTIR
jgi:hypothetical protein